MERKSLIPIKAVASVAKGMSDKKEDLPPLPEPIMCKRLSNLGGAWFETLSATTLSYKTATNRKKGPEEVAQTAQVKGLPDVDHACYFLAVLEEMSPAITKKAVGRRVRDLERPLV